MSNHEVDCPYCGLDQRLNDPCCGQWLAYERDRHAARHSERQRLRGFILGIDPNARINQGGAYYDTMQVIDVVRLIGKLVPHTALPEPSGQSTLSAHPDDDPWGP